VLARVLLAQERPAEALALLDRLHATAVAQDPVGSVIEAGALRALALAACGQAAAGVPLGCLARLQRALDAGHARPGPRSGTAPVAMPGLAEQLTSRELEVLGMLAAGRSNQAIAGQLVVTLDTVKKHVSHLLGKLGAANRTEAVTRARKLGLIP